jgi:cyclophilin family peptidyl-prolyl cis-trans isomerase/HEAT repeat protein
MSQCGPSSRLAIRAPRQEKSLGLVARDAIPAAFDRRVLLVLCLGLTLTRCAAAPPPAPIPVLVSYEQKLAWILRLEDQRLLRDPALPDPEDPRSVEGEDPEPPPATGGDAASGVLSLLPSATPDLLRLIEDPSAAIRRRSAAAIGRVRLADGIPALVSALSDPQMAVREIAAFGLGLIGDLEAADPLVEALRDVSPVVQGRAAQALGMLGARGTIDAIQSMVAMHVTEAYAVDPEELSYPLTPRIEAFRSGLYALAELGSYDALAATILTEEGEPVLWWWPVAYALTQVDDSRAAGPLKTLVGIQGSIGVAIAAAGLGAIGDTSALPVLVELLDPRRRDARVIITAVRALAEIGDEQAAPALRRLLRTPDLEPALLLELVEALGAVGARSSTDVMIELLSHPWPPVRGAALRGLARLDAELFVLVLSGLQPDSHWQVRADLANALAFVDPDVGAFRLTLMLGDEDRRVIPAVLRSLVTLRATNAVDVLLTQLSDGDVVVRKTAATLLGELEVRQAVEALATAYRDAAGDPSYLARAAVVDALARIGGRPALETLRAAVEDPDWAVRVRAAQHLATRDPASDAETAIRPAPARFSVEAYGSLDLVTPSVSPHVFIDTDLGTIQIELAVNEAPLTADNFMRLARTGFYNGLLVHRVVPNYIVQTGDPRSDSEGGPGYTVRDELSPLPFLRGTVGMALDWADTGGSQFFITRSPQPQLDARYTVFGKVIAGMEVVDQLKRGDVIRLIRVWDGTTPPA